MRLYVVLVVFDLIDEDVVGLNISVNNLVLVKKVQGQKHLLHNAPRPLFTKLFLHGY